MGDMADDLMRQHLEEHMDFALGISKIKPTTQSHIWWVQKDGTTINICNMSVTHLRNSIKMIERRDRWRKSWLVPLQTELKSR